MLHNEFLFENICFDTVENKPFKNKNKQIICRCHCIDYSSPIYDLPSTHPQPRDSVLFFSPAVVPNLIFSNFFRRSSRYREEREMGRTGSLAWVRFDMACIGLWSCLINQSSQRASRFVLIFFIPKMRFPICQR